MQVGKTIRSVVRLGAAAAAVYGTAATLQRLGEQNANAGLARGKRFLILGGGFAGAAVASELARLLPGDDNGEIVLVDEDNYLLFTPMLTEAAGGELQTDEIVSPTRSLGRRVHFVQGSITGIDVAHRSVDVAVGVGSLDPAQQTLTGDFLILALGSVVNFHNTPGVADNAIPMKRLDDATRVFRHVSACLERATVEPDAARRRELLTFVVAGGGYTGVETMASLNDLVRSSAERLPQLDPKEVSTILVHPGDRLLPEITPDLATFATGKLQQRGVDVRLHAEVSGAGPDFVSLKDGTRIATRTVVWAAGVTPNPLLKDLGLRLGKHHGVVVSGAMEVADHEGLWALGDCAEIPEPNGEGTYAPTAQNATREGKMLARNLIRKLRGEPLRPFRYTPVGELALVGRRSGVARVYGLNFSGFIAWAMWRAVYLAKMPGFAQQSRILLQWTLDELVGHPAAPLSSGRQVQMKAGH